jgi:hypothetical protein
MKKLASMLAVLALLAGTQPSDTAEGEAVASKNRDQASREQRQQRQLWNVAPALAPPVLVVPIFVTLKLVGTNCEVDKVKPPSAKVPINALVHFIYVNGCDNKKKVRIEKKPNNTDILYGECRNDKDVGKPDPNDLSANISNAYCILINVQIGKKYLYNIDGDVKKDPEIDVQGPGLPGEPE